MAGQGGLREYMAFHGAQHLGAGGPGDEFQRYIEGIEVELVTVHRPRRRIRAIPTQFAKTVQPLTGAIGQLIYAGQALG